MKKSSIIILLTMLMSMVSTKASADYDIAVENADGVTIYYYWINDKTELTVCYPGIYNRYSGDVVIPRSVEYYGITYPVTSISGGAFSSCSNLTSVTIPNSVTSIGEKAFYGCKKLSSVKGGYNITSIGNNAFQNSSLTSITISSKFSDAGYAGFKGISVVNVSVKDLLEFCNNTELQPILEMTGDRTIKLVDNEGVEIKDLVIPAGVTSIGEKAFYNCRDLTSLTITNGVKDICQSAFQNCSGLTSVTIPNSVTSIGWFAFQGCRGLTSIDIPNSVTLINWHAFDGCSGLTSIDIPNSVNEIGGYTFQHCTNLTTVTIPNSVTSISSKAFYGCTNLESINFPESMGSIGNEAFWGCEALTSITIPSSVTYIGEQAFLGCGGHDQHNLDVNISDLAEWCNIDIRENVFSVSNNDGYSLYLNGEYLTELEIPKEVTEIKNNTFTGCNNTIKLHDGITSIGNKAFEFGNVSSMSGFKGVKRIGDYAFAFSNLSSIELPEGMTSIGKYAFSNTNIQSMIIPKTIESIGKMAFESCNSLKYVFFSSESLPTFNYDSNYKFKVIMSQTAFDKGIGTITNYATFSKIPMIIEIKLKGATSAIFNLYPVDEYGFIDEQNMKTVSIIGLNPGEQLSWKLDEENYGILSDKTNETVTLTVEEPKALSTTKARLLAAAEEADDVEHFGFEWRRIDSSDLIKSKVVSSPLYNGTIVGTLNNLNPDVEYKYRPFYKSDSGETYYGEWMGLFTGDADVFYEPEVYTKDAEDITKVSALLAGIWLEGTDDIEEKGFEYWTVSGSKTRAIGSDVKKVAVSGSSNAMTTTLEGLKSGATYGFRSYVKTTKGKMTYGEEKTFKTILIGDVDGDGKLTNADADAIAKHIIGQTPSGFNKKMADVNDDGDVNVIDIVLLVKMIE